MNKLSVVIMMVFLGSVANAHKHGQAKMSLAFDGKQGKVVVTAPADMIYGFEGEARSAKERKQKEQGLQKFEEKIAEAIVLDPEIKCEIKKDMFQVNQESKHADVEAEFRVTCQSVVAGTSIQFNPRKIFSRFKSMNVEINADTVQKSVEIKKDGERIELQ